MNSLGKNIFKTILLANVLTMVGCDKEKKEINAANSAKTEIKGPAQWVQMDLLGNQIYSVGMDVVDDVDHKTYRISLENQSGDYADAEAFIKNTDIFTNDSKEITDTNPESFITVTPMALDNKIVIDFLDNKSDEVLKTKHIEARITKEQTQFILGASTNQLQSYRVPNGVQSVLRPKMQGFIANKLSEDMNPQTQAKEKNTYKVVVRALNPVADLNQ